MAKLIECVPNFSVSKEKDEAVFQALVDTANSVAGCTTIDVQTDGNHNRCVFTIVGSPEGIQEVAFQLTKKATELIDMTKHQGQHPRMGATDVHGGDEGDNVGSAHTGRLALMLVHVDQLSSLLGQLESDFLDGVGVADDGENAAVMVAVRLNVDGGAAGNSIGGIDQSLEYSLVLFLGDREIRYAFDELCHE